MRRNSGQMAELTLLISLLLSFLAAGLIFDVYRLGCVQAQLQHAADAGALAGLNESLRDPQLAAEAAQSVANRCTINGISLEDSDTLFEFLLDELPYGAPRSQVTLGVTVNNLAMWLVGHGQENICVTSAAVAGPPLGMLAAGQCFPLAPCLYGLDTVSGKRLCDLIVGDRLTLVIAAQGTKNASFASFNQSKTDADYVRSAVLEVLGLSGTKVVPSVSKSQTVNLINGIAGQKELASPPLSNCIISQKQIVLPVLDCAEPSTSAKVAGFLAVKIDSITVRGGSEALCFTCTVVPSVGVGTASGASFNPVFERLGTRAVVLSR